MVFSCFDYLNYIEKIEYKKEGHHSAFRPDLYNHNNSSSFDISPDHPRPTSVQLHTNYYHLAKMQFSVFIVALLAVGVNSKAIADVDVGTSDNEIFRRDSFDCNGNSLCGVAVNFVRDCDIAVNQQIIRDNNGNYGAPG